MTCYIWVVCFWMAKAEYWLVGLVSGTCNYMQLLAGHSPITLMCLMCLPSDYDVFFCKVCLFIHDIYFPTAWYTHIQNMMYSYNGWMNTLENVIKIIWCNMALYHRKFLLQWINQACVNIMHDSIDHCPMLINTDQF